MNDTMHDTSKTETQKRPRDWLQTLAGYREPSPGRSVLEIVITAVPLAVLWWLAWKSLDYSYLLTLVIAVPASLLLVRLFLIQHDCGHGAFFRRKATNDWIGRLLGVLTLTPYDVWKRSHAVHHATSGNLDRRGMGDIDTLTVREYRALPAWRRLAYRMYRNPLVMFGIGPAIVFLLQHRLPFGHMREGWQYWVSAMATNLGIAAFFTGMIYLVGVQSFVMVHLPIVLLASSLGVWLFYVQHQFEETYWAKERDGWDVHDAAFQGSSYYALPGVLRWFTANIGIHHVHHLYSKIPYYRLSQVLRDYPELAQIHRLTIWESFRCVRLRLWDEAGRRLVSFEEARAIR